MGLQLETYGTSQDKEKFCSSCKTLVSVESFTKQASSKDGLRYCCKNCDRVVQKKRYAEKKAKAIKDGTCWSYGCNNKNLGHRLDCLEHFYMMVARRNLGTKEFKHGRGSWESLKKLAEKQNYKCALTGEELTPGKNMSLDHILPIKTHPTKRSDINNVQWVTGWANIAKSHYSEEEFYRNCEKAYKYKNQEGGA
jgi:hypothetical protein